MEVFYSVKVKLYIKIIIKITYGNIEILCNFDSLRQGETSERYSETSRIKKPIGRFIGKKRNTRHQSIASHENDTATFVFGI